jgi:hypothetical protein
MNARGRRPKKYAVEDDKPIEVGDLNARLGTPGFFPSATSKRLDREGMRMGWTWPPPINYEGVSFFSKGFKDFDYETLCSSRVLKEDILKEMHVIEWKKLSAGDRRENRSGNAIPKLAIPKAGQKEAWMGKLAKLDDSLHAMGKTAPNGFQGSQLIRSLAANDVPFLRATWYIKIVHLNEVSCRYSRLHSVHSVACADVCRYAPFAYLWCRWSC